MPIDIDRTLRQALGELEAERQRLDQRIAAIRSALDGAVPATAPTARSPRRRRMNSAARQEVSRRMKAYWAKRRAEKARAASSPASRGAQQPARKRAARRARRKPAAKKAASQTQAKRAMPAKAKAAKAPTAEGTA
jgi:histone H1/5